MKELVLSGISKRFGGVAALQSVDLVARSGQIHGLIGENGAGKSTVVRILSGVVQADAGTISFGGRHLALRSRQAARHAGIATAFQELSLIRDWDVATNLLYGREPVVRAGRVGVRASRDEARQAMESVGIANIHPARLVRDLRLAERQTLEIIRALIANPTVLILDEPTSALTPTQVRWFFEAVRSFVAAGGLVLFISHRLAEVREFCNHVTVLRDGRNVGTGPIESMSEPRLIQLMLGAARGRIEAGESAGRGSRRRAFALKLDRFASPPMLNEIDLEVGAGEIVGVAGLEGQGQLELFLALYGVLRSTGTMVGPDGRALHLSSPAVAIRHGVVLVPQERGLALCLPLPIRDNVTLASLAPISRLGLINGRKEASLVRRLMASLRIRARNSLQPVETLSGGNQQKVLLARVLALKPRLLLMYDATRGVDVGTTAEIFDLMREFSSTGVGILFYSSDVTELTNLCDRVIVMHDGSIKAELQGSNLTEERILAAAVGADNA